MATETLRARRINSVTIPAAGAVSSLFDARGMGLLNVSIPPGFLGTSISFQVCSTAGGAYQALYGQDGTLVSQPVLADRAYPLHTAVTGWPFFKIVSNATETAGATLTVVASN